MVPLFIMVPGVRYWKKISGREMGGRRGWVDFGVWVAMFEGCKEGGKAVTNGDVAVIVAKLDF